jgi:hypothetical protein
MTVRGNNRALTLTEETPKNEKAGTGPIDPVAGKSVAEIFGEIVWLMSQDKEARELSIKDLERLVMPPILLKQFHITYAPIPNRRTSRGEVVHQVDAGSVLQPVAIALFAMCSTAVAAALDLRGKGAIPLALQDWRSGSEKRVVLYIDLQNTPN